MNSILLFIYRILNIIFSIVGIIIIILTFITWPLFGYLFMCSEYFDTDIDEHIEIVWDIIHYPLNKLYEFINDMDDFEFNFNKILNNKFWK